VNKYWGRQAQWELPYAEEDIRNVSYTDQKTPHMNLLGDGPSKDGTSGKLRDEICSNNQEALWPRAFPCPKDFVGNFPRRTKKWARTSSCCSIILVFFLALHADLAYLSS
jgi:hypothetical protein